MIISLDLFWEGESAPSDDLQLLGEYSMVNNIALYLTSHGSLEVTRHAPSRQVCGSAYQACEKLGHRIGTHEYALCVG